MITPYSYRPFGVDLTQHKLEKILPNYDTTNWHIKNITSECNTECQQILRLLQQVKINQFSFAKCYQNQIFKPDSNIPALISHDRYL